MSYATPPDTSGLGDPDRVICSAQKCRQPALWAVIWNNPKIHTPDREKVWTACDTHRPTLSEYLVSHRMNLIRVDALTESTDSEPGN